HGSVRETRIRPTACRAVRPAHTDAGLAADRGGATDTPGKRAGGRPGVLHALGKRFAVGQSAIATQFDLDGSIRTEVVGPLQLLQRSDSRIDGGVRIADGDRSRARRDGECRIRHVRYLRARGVTSRDANATV